MTSSRYELATLNTVLLHTSYDDLSVHLKELYTLEEFELIHTIYGYIEIQDKELKQNISELQENEKKSQQTNQENEQTISELRQTISIFLANETVNKQTINELRQAKQNETVIPGKTREAELEQTISTLQAKIIEYESEEYQKRVVKAFHKRKNERHKPQRLQKKGIKVECELCGVTISIEGRKRHQMTEKCKIGSLLTEMAD
jgi:hypothetical protein